MYSKNELLEHLKNMGINGKGTLLVHSSLKSIGGVEGGADTVLDALSEYMRDGLLILPTHTWKYIDADNPLFDVKNSPSNVGILTELFRKRKNVIRSEHPTHSVAALGDGAEEFVEGEYRHDTACARESVWGKIVDHKAQILMLGVDLTKCTFMHGIEEWVDVPDRLNDHHDNLYSILHTGEKVVVPTRRHSGSSSSDHFWKVDEILLEEGVMSKGKIGDAESRLLKADETAQLLTELLRKNPDLFTDNEPLTEEWRFYFQRKNSDNE